MSKLTVAIDTETSGLDFHHGSRPFFITTCDSFGNQQSWEWDVDPETRAVTPPESDLHDFQVLLSEADRIVLQNGKFDFGALTALYEAAGLTLDWPWDRMHDTLVAAHVLASNRPHGLTELAVQYLRTDIESHEDNLHKAVQQARRQCKSKFPTWRIADDEDEMLPSAGDAVWKADYWLPKAFAKADNLPADHPWHTVLATYGDWDSVLTLAVWNQMERQLHDRNLWKIYESRMRVIPVIASMEKRGVTISGDRLDTLRTMFVRESKSNQEVCVAMAKGEGYALTLPKSGSNKSLTAFCFDVLKLPPKYNPKSKTGEPSLNKDVMAAYMDELPTQSKPRQFIKTLMASRSRNTAVAYMDGYKRFWRPIPTTNFSQEEAREFANWHRLHPTLNLTGSKTLRCTSQNPNEQNISKKEGFNLRYAFGPAPGREWWSLDAKNIELRLPAYASGELDMIQLFENPDSPPYFGSNHLLNFHAAYPDLWDLAVAEVGPDSAGKHCKKKYASSWYQRVKNGGFAIQYGAVDKLDGTGTADRAFGRPGTHAKIKARFTKLEALNRKQIADANFFGYVQTIPDVTVDPDRGYPLLCTRTEWGGILETVPLSYHIQGSAMWWTTQAMVRCEAQLADWRKQDFDGYIAMQVHDEMVFDLPKRAHPKKDPKRSNLGRINILKRLMEVGGDNFRPKVPTPVGVEYHETHWGEGVTLA